MQTIDEILDAARRLSDDERRQLVEALQGQRREEPTEGQRRQAMLRWVGVAGAFHSDFADVATQK